MRTWPRRFSAASRSRSARGDVTPAPFQRPAAAILPGPSAPVPCAVRHDGGVQSPLFASAGEVGERLGEVGYLTDDATATTVFLADRLGKPLLVEGPAGVGKTELAKAVAAATGSGLVRLQCYEGIDEARALYEWDYRKQLLRLQVDRDAGETGWETERGHIFSEEFLLARDSQGPQRRSCRDDDRPCPQSLRRAGL